MNDVDQKETKRFHDKVLNDHVESWLDLRRMIGQRGFDDKMFLIHIVDNKPPIKVSGKKIVTTLAQAGAIGRMFPSDFSSSKVCVLQND